MIWYLSESDAGDLRFVYGVAVPEAPVSVYRMTAGDDRSLSLYWVEDGALVSAPADVEVELGARLPGKYDSENYVLHVKPGGFSRMTDGEGIVYLEADLVVNGAALDFALNGADPLPEEIALEAALRVTLPAGSVTETRKVALRIANQLVRDSTTEPAAVDPGYPAKHLLASCEEVAVAASGTTVLDGGHVYAPVASARILAAGGNYTHAFVLPSAVDLEGKRFDVGVSMPVSASTVVEFRDGANGSALVTSLPAGTEDGEYGLGFSVCEGAWVLVWYAAPGAAGGGGGGDLSVADIDTLAELNAIVTDATLIDTADARLSDSRTPTAHNHAAADTNSGTFADARIAESNVTQHQSALTITESQIADLNHDISAASTTAAGKVELATAAEIDTGTDNARAVTPLGLAGSALQTKLDGIETGATADQSAAEIETAYNTQVGQVSAGEKTAGTETGVRRFSPDDVKDMIDAHAGGGGDLSAADIDTLAELNAVVTDATLIDTADARLSDARTPTAHNHAAADTNSGTFADARIAESNVTQHQSALTITESQISDLDHDIAAASTTAAGKVELATAAEIDTGTDNARAVTPLGLAGSALQTKLDGIETGATADQSAAEIETAYNTQVGQVSAGEKTAGTETGVRRFSPDDVKDMIDAHAGGGGDLSAADIDTLAELNAVVTDATLIDTADARLSDARTPTAHNHAAADTNSGTFADARIAESNVTQHQSALTITESQIADLNHDIAAASTTAAGKVELATAAEIDTGTDNARAVTPLGLAGSALQTKLNGIETGATADQSAAEIETAYNTQVGQVSAGEKTAGTETGVRRFSPDDVKDMIDAHAGGGGDLSAADIDTLAELNAIVTDATLIDTADARLSDARTPTAHNHAAADTNSGTFADARIAESNVTQHQSALTITESQIADLNHDIAAASTTAAGKVELATAAEIDTGTDNARAVTPLGLAGSALQTKLDGIETGATADQSAAEIETAYNAQVGQVSAGEKTAGTETGVRRFSPDDVKDMIDTHGAAGAGGKDFKFLASDTASADATISFDLGSLTDFDVLKIEFYNVAPASDAVALRMILRNATPADISGTYYSSFTYVQQDGALNGENTNLSSTSGFEILSNIGNAANEEVSGTLTLFPNASGDKQVHWQLSYANNAGNHYSSSGGGWMSSGSTFEGVKFQMGSGNIAGGTFLVYGLSNKAMGGGSDATALHDDVAGEIAAISEKTTPVGADLAVIEDSAAANVKKSVQLSNLGAALSLASSDLTDSTTVGESWFSAADIQAQRRLIGVRADLAGGTALAINTRYFDSFTANRTLTFSGSPIDGDIVSLEFDVSSGPVTLTVPASYRFQTSGTTTSLRFEDGAHSVVWVRSDGKWFLSDTGQDAQTANFVFASPDGSAGSGAFRALVSDDLPAGVATRQLTAVFDGGGSALTAGTKVFASCPVAGTINKVRVLADVSGSVVVDVWKDTLANYPPTDADSITSAAPPTISSDTDSEDATLTGWTTSVSAGDVFGFNVDSATTITRATVELEILV